MRVLPLAMSLFLLQLSCKHNTEPVDDFPYPTLPALDISWNSQNSVVCFGTSLTYGYGAGVKNPFCKTRIAPAGKIEFIRFSTAQILSLQGTFEHQRLFMAKRDNCTNGCSGDSSYPRFLSERLKIRVENQGYTGARIQMGLDIVDDSVLSKKPALVLLEFGANDFLQKRDVKISDSLLSLLVQRLLAANTKVVLLSFIHPDMIDHAPSGSRTTSDSALALQYYEMLKAVADRFGILFVDYPLQGVFGDGSMMSDALHPNGRGYQRMEENISHMLMRTFVKNGMLR